MPSVLILGGLGFLGRHLVHYLVTKNLSNDIKVVDKVLVPTAYLSKTHTESFQDPRVQVVQANLCSQGISCVTVAGIEKAFAKQYDIVINLAAETKYGLTTQVYEEKVLALSLMAAKQSLKTNCKVFIELSTAQVYDSDKKASSEDSKLKPWTNFAKSKLDAEEQLLKIEGLNLGILRPSIVYGPFDIRGITPRLIIGAVYRHLKEEMTFLWTKDLKINTVHVNDTVRAIWLLATKKLESPSTKASVYNLSDKASTDQGFVNKFIESIFGIKTGFQGTIISQFAKLNLDSVTEDVNEKHLQPWSEICKQANIINTPLTPYLDKELLKDNSLSVDGSKIETELGFKYDYPEMNEALLREVIDEFINIGIWPKGTTQ